jgi:hypothetical protein
MCFDNPIILSFHPWEERREMIMYYNWPPLDQWASDTLDNAVPCRFLVPIQIARRGWVSSIVIMASSTTDESHRSRFLRVCFSCLFINGSALSLSCFSLFSLLWVCVRRGAALVFPWSLLQPYMAEQDGMLIACCLDLNWAGLESGDAERSLCVFLRIWIISTDAHEVVDNRTQWGETRVCLFVCLFVCLLCV